MRWKERSQLPSQEEEAVDDGSSIGQRSPRSFDGAVSFAIRHGKREAGASRYDQAKCHVAFSRSAQLPNNSGSEVSFSSPNSRLYSSYSQPELIISDLAMSEESSGGEGRWKQ